MRAGAAVAALLGFPGLPLHAQFPATPPPAVALRPFRLPAAREDSLANGLRVLMLENHELPVLSLSLSMPGGTGRDPVGHEGVATLVAELLTRGTRARTADQMASDLQRAGGTVNADATADFLTVSIDGVSDGAALLFELLGDVTENAVFPAPEFERARTRLAESLAAEASDPQALADRYFAAALFGNHPYGRKAGRASVESITLGEVAAHASTWLRPRGALLVVAGDLSPADAKRLAQRYLGDWRGAAPTPASPATLAARPTRILLVHRPGAVESRVVVGNLALRPGDPRHYALAVSNRILGGDAEARLSRALREHAGAREARSALARRRDASYLVATTQVRAAVTDQAVVELADQLHQLQIEPVADSELARAKAYLVGSFPREAETPRQLAAQVANAKLLGLGDDYVRTFRERVASVTAADVLAAAREAIKPDSAVVVVVGDGARVYDKLRTIAPVDIVDLRGQPLGAGALHPEPGPLPLARDQLVSRRDSFLVFVQGNPLGSMITETRAGGDSLVYHEQLAVPVARWNLETTARLDLGSLEMRSLDQTGQMANQSAATHLEFSRGRVRGRAQIPQPGGTPKVVQIDTVVAPGVIDQNAVGALVPALPLEPGISHAVSAFDAAEGSVKVVTVTVTAVGTLSVPAGVFSVFQVQLTGIPNPAFLYVTRDSPRRVVKVEQMGRPMSFELAK